MKVEHLHLRMLLEGVEQPVVSAQITMRRNTAATASIQIVPTPLAHMILPRSFVLLFALDDQVPTTRVVSPDGTTVVQEHPAAGYEAPERVPGERTLPVVPDSYLRYKVVFMGEVVATSYQKSQGNRAVVLQCSDLSNYWDCVMHDRRDGLFPPTKNARLGGNAQGAFFDLLGGDTGAMYSKLEKPPDCFPQLALRDSNGRPRPSFLGGIMHLMEEVFGTYHRRVTIEGQGGTVIGSQNPFAAMAELRLRLLQQVGLPPEDSTPMKLLQTQGFGSIWRRSVRGLPAQFNFRTLMGALMQYTFYGTFPLTSPMYQPPEGVYAQQMGWSKAADTPPAADQPAPSAGLPMVRAQIRRLQTLTDQMYIKVGRAAPWTADNYRRLTYSDGYNMYLSNVVDIALECRTYVFQSQSSRYTELMGPLAKLQVVAAQGKAFVSRFQVGFTGASGPSGTIQQVRNLCGEILGYLSAPRTPRNRSTSEGDQPAFLYSQLMMPDIWFCPPPRCNVLFPDLVSNISFSRNYLAEPTRLMVQGYSQFFGSDPLFDKWYFAPTSVGLLREGPVVHSGSSAATGDSGIKNDLMAHELFTGIIPMFQKMSDREMTMGASLGSAGANRDEISGEALDYFQRVVNFLFFKTRFASRSMSISGVFNPRAVPGMPCLVMDVPTDGVDTAINEAILQTGEEALAGVAESQKSDILTLIRGRTGVHHMGVFEAITHNLSATGGGTTEYVVSYARDHRESVELFGIDQVEVQKKRKRYRELRRRWNQNERDVLAQRAQELMTGAWGIVGVRQDVREFGDPTHASTGQAIAAGHIDRMLEGVVAGVATASRGLQALSQSQDEVAVDRELITSRKLTVASFAPGPQVGATGPWGGPLTAVVDVTDRVRTTPPPLSPEARQQTAQIDRIIADLEKARATVGVHASPEALAELDEDLTAYKARRSQVQRVGRGSGPRRFVLFGTYNGQRMAQAQIPSNLLGDPHPAREFGPDVVSYVGTDDPDAETTLYAYEITEDISEGAGIVDMGLEDVVRPSWYPAIWDNGRIGGAVYRPLLGTTAITDPLAVIAPGGFEEALQAIRDGRPQPTPGTSEPPGPIVGDILNGASVEGAVDFLVHTYSRMRSQGYDLAEFARQYTWRPVATIFDLLGSADLEIASNGTITQGVEGFFSRAFGPYSDLFGIAPGDTIKLLGIEEEDVAARARLDVRGQRYALAVAYQQELQSRLLSRG